MKSSRKKKGIIKGQTSIRGFLTIKNPHIGRTEEEKIRVPPLPEVVGLNDEPGLGTGCEHHLGEEETGRDQLSTDVQEVKNIVQEERRIARGNEGSTVGGEERERRQPKVSPRIENNNPVNRSVMGRARMFVKLGDERAVCNLVGGKCETHQVALNYIKITSKYIKILQNYIGIHQN